MLEIDLWLNSKNDYTEGLKLFLPHCKNDVLAEVLSSGPSYYNRIRLKEELIKLKDLPPLPEEPKKPEPKSLWRKDLPTLPLNIQELYFNAIHLKKENAKHQSALMEHVRIALSLPTIEQEEAYMRSINAGDWGNEILDTDDVLADMYARIDYYEANGRLPEETIIPDLDMTSIEMLQELRRKRSFVSKQQNNTARAAEVAEARERILVLEANLKRLE